MFGQWSKVSNSTQFFFIEIWEEALSINSTKEIDELKSENKNQSTFCVHGC